MCVYVNVCVSSASFRLPKRRCCRNSSTDRPVTLVAMRMSTSCHDQLIHTEVRARKQMEGRDGMRTQTDIQRTERGEYKGHRHARMCVCVCPTYRGEAVVPLVARLVGQGQLGHALDLGVQLLVRIEDVVLVVELLFCVCVCVCVCACVCNIPPLLPPHPSAHLVHGGVVHEPVRQARPAKQRHIHTRNIIVGKISHLSQHWQPEQAASAASGMSRVCTHVWVSRWRISIGRTSGTVSVEMCMCACV